MEHAKGYLSWPEGLVQARLVHGLPGCEGKERRILITGVEAALQSETRPSAVKVAQQRPFESRNRHGGVEKPAPGKVEFWYGTLPLIQLPRRMNRKVLDKLHVGEAERAQQCRKRGTRVIVGGFQNIVLQRSFLKFTFGFLSDLTLKMGIR